ncbi:adenylosuccinate synthetase [Hymenobacter sp. M29]|uniref:Adenylosuccinate synthetase n=1 Tax=Hymenobacter mellowenesis TaxID=3063995 RepID=A0ABT9AJ97_9BACT|nr:adenylosuccinate synthetase [Hymenobacter sp. M29]MDO7849940.1 adenylosuccinate synthetase [Hymenobacter sp. M29]
MAINSSQSAFIVVGLGFGDEGKGLATDYLSSVSASPLVIRFNGGHQAGHTVVTSDGTSHIFSTLGAGTLRGVPTYWSRHCTLAPSVLLPEIASLPIKPKLFVDELCPVTTHYDILYNRALESTRSTNRHGSCGLGFGATVQRHSQPSLRLCANDLLSPALFTPILQRIREYYKDKITNETNYDFDDFNHDREDSNFYSQIQSVNSLLDSKIVEFVKEEEIFGPSHPWQTFIFEGAQGILLDKKFGFQPHVTQSNTTSQNAIQLLLTHLPHLVNEARIVYTTRSYLTRHGAGPMPELSDKPVLINLSDETNVYNEFQGEFRIAHLNLDLLRYAIGCDSEFSAGNNKWLLVTCLDQVNHERLTCCYKGEALELSYRQIPSFLDSDFERYLFSFSSCADNLEN